MDAAFCSMGSTSFSESYLCGGSVSEKGDYVNFDYVTLGWNVPIEKVQKLKKYVRSLRLAFTVNNLATISGYSGLSPMINSSTVNSTLGVDDKRGYPLARIYILGLSINF